jgi:beta-glucosidase
MSAPRLKKNGEIIISVSVENTSGRAGDEVVQLYMSWVASNVDRPIKQLAGFKRMTIKAGETAKVQMPLKAADLASWNADKHVFEVEEGRVTVMVGASSADIRLKKIVSVEG